MIYGTTGKRDSRRVKLLEHKTGLKVGKCIYNMFGAFLFLSGDKVIKVVDTSGGYFTYAKIKPVLKWAKTTKLKNIAKIFNHGEMVCDGKVYYFYVMEKLTELPKSYDEELASIVSAYNSYCTKENLKLLSPRVQKFIKATCKMKFSYTDIHGRNIMMDKRGSFKFVDLEGFRGEE